MWLVRSRRMRHHEQQSAGHTWHTPRARAEWLWCVYLWLCMAMAGGGGVGSKPKSESTNMHVYTSVHTSVTTHMQLTL